MSMWRCEYCGEWNDFSKQHECPELPRLKARVAELEHKLDELHRRELKANPEWVQLRTLKSGAVCDGQCGGESGEPCGTCKADAEWSARVAENESRLAERTEWLVTRLRQTAQGIEDRYRPLDEEVPKTKQL